MTSAPFPEASLDGPWSADAVAEYLDSARIPVRLAKLAPDGWPGIVSLWFMRSGDHLLCATRRDATTTASLLEHPRCAFEVSGETIPYRGVRGLATVEIEDRNAEAVLTALIERYLGSTETPFARWLLGRIDGEVVLRLAPVSISSWDFGERMPAEA